MSDDPSLTEGERTRRQALVQQLRSKEREVQEMSARRAKKGGRSERDQLLLEGGGISDMGATSWGSPVEGGDDDVLVNADATREALMKEQDEGLDSLHSVISRQRRLAEMIGGEAESQVTAYGHEKETTSWE